MEATQNGVAQHEETSSVSQKAQGMRSLKQKISDRTATIGVIGLGYVGLPLAVEYAKAGFDTIGIDLNTDRVAQLNAGENYNDDLDDAEVREVVDDGRLSADDHFGRSADIDVFYVCVPTPVTAHKDPDTSYIESAMRSVAEHLRPGQLVILKSTTYPNTTEGLVQPILEEAAAERNMHLGRDYFLAFSPERIDPGNQEYTTANTPVVVGGVTPACTELAALAMGQVVEHIHEVSSPKVAEMEKLLENIFRSVNIALVNELARLCDRIGGVSMWEVVEAAATKPFGFMPFYPGPGLGGHCIPIDPHYLSWLARKHNFETSFITLSARINEEMPFYVADAVVRAIAQRPVRLSDAKVLVLGVAFKKNVDDTRHSPAHAVIQLLQERGVDQIRYCDPHVPSFTASTVNGDPIPLERLELTNETLQEHDVAVILTDHDAFPYGKIVEQAPLIVDTRNALDHIPHSRDKVVLLGGGDF
jgi:UDP-N-acetyl-D-glucosamine dehydrogenase